MNVDEFNENQNTQAEDIPAEEELQESSQAEDIPAEEELQEIPQAQEDPAQEDVVPEESGEAAEEPSPSEAALREALGKALADAEDLKNKWYSVSAEYENYRKRTSSARAQAYTEGRKDVVVKLFPIADSLERALDACSDEKTRQGISMVIKNFEKLLEGERIGVIAPVGEPFDASRCEAIFAVDPEEGEESGIVREVYAKGYEQDGKVLRFAQVLVTK